MASVVKLNFKQRISKKLADEIKSHIREFDMPEEARAELDNSLYRISNSSTRRWVFVMINPEQFRFVMNATEQTSKPDFTWKVFTSAITYIRMDTGEVMADRDQLAKSIKALPRDVSTAMTELTKIGAIYKEKRGRKTAYFVNPNVGWAGGEGSRLTDAQGVPKLRLVAGGKVEPDGPLPVVPPVEPLLAPVIKYLRGANIAERLKWATKAIENGAPPLESMTDKKVIPRWAGYLMFDHELARLLPKEEEGEP